MSFFAYSIYTINYKILKHSWNNFFASFSKVSQIFIDGYKQNSLILIKLNTTHK